jgi:hypothetical protein
MDLEDTHFLTLAVAFLLSPFHFASSISSGFIPLHSSGKAKLLKYK